MLAQRSVEILKGSVMAFTTYENRNNPHVTIHRDGCNQIRKRGGHHVHGQGGYRQHRSFSEASEYATASRMHVVLCSFCRPGAEGATLTARDRAASVKGQHLNPRRRAATRIVSAPPLSAEQGPPAGVQSLNPSLTLHDLSTARQLFEENEPRDLFYRAATELVRLALRGEASMTVPEALAVLLQTWNRAYYRYRRFDAQHFTDIEHLITENKPALTVFRDREILALDECDAEAVKRVFGAFEFVLGPVGAAKALHLLAPSFFPIWDRAIADAYALPLGPVGTNSERYWAFMVKARAQSAALGGSTAVGRNVLKAIDEFNYCRYTMKLPFSRE